MNGIVESAVVLIAIFWIWGLFSFFGNFKEYAREGEIFKMLFLTIIFPFAILVIVFLMAGLGIGGAYQ